MGPAGRCISDTIRFYCWVNITNRRKLAYSFVVSDFWGSAVLVQFRTFIVLIQYFMHRLCVLAFALTALVLVVLTALAAFGSVPWLGLSVTVGDTVFDQAGKFTQIGGTALAVMLCFFLPANARIMKLETSHRRFTIGMHDVARAYALAHAADREGVFHLSSEFDAVRERLAYLRDHPDLESLEPQLLEVAAQMSHISRELAEIYSAEKVERARDCLRQRQREVARFNTRIDAAKQITSELKHWLHEVELEEAVAASQLQRLREDLDEVLPELGDERIAQADGTVIDLAAKAAE